MRKKKKFFFPYTATDNTPFDFSDYIRLINFAEDVYKNDLSYDEAREEQKKMQKKIEDFKKRANPSKGIEPKKIIIDKNVIKNADDIYELRNKIISEIKKAEKGESEETKKLDWLHRPKRELNDLIKII